MAPSDGSRSQKTLWGSKVVRVKEWVPLVEREELVFGIHAINSRNDATLGGWWGGDWQQGRR